MSALTNLGVVVGALGAARIWEQADIQVAVVLTAVAFALAGLVMLAHPVDRTGTLLGRGRAGPWPRPDVARPDSAGLASIRRLAVDVADELGQSFVAEHLADRRRLADVDSSSDR